MSNEKKTINYNGMKLECIESGYWPDGITLVLRDRDDNTEPVDVKVICLHNGIAFYADGESSAEWGCWAILPPKPAPRRLTMREVYGLWHKGWAYMKDGFVMEPGYSVSDEKRYALAGAKLRAPNTDEWLEPTSDLLEVGE